MSVSPGECVQKFVEQTPTEGLRLVEEREARLSALRDQLNASIAAEGDNDDERLDAALAEEARALSDKGF
ncbi:MAG TPA: type II toxin-antitoxin system ParD family antitoxin [Ensifer sp.]|nr:type II toxin-antitoxin system ParD family antitoxin [Ensifer sp.]